MSKIQIFSVIGKNGIIFSQFLRETMIKLASNEHELEFNCFMSSREKPPFGWSALEYIMKQKHTSLNHTIGLNRVLDFINGDFVICSDVDIAVLCPNWDTIMVEKIKRQNIDVIGVDHWDNNRGYKNFPIVTFFMAKSRSHLRAQPDLRPALTAYPNKHGIGAEVMKIKNMKDVFIFNMQLGRSLLKDSGWQLPYSYKTVGLKGQVFIKVPKIEIEQVPQIWELNGNIIICHKGKSSKRRQSHGFRFIDGVTEYISKIHGIEINKRK